MLVNKTLANFTQPKQSINAIIFIKQFILLL